MPGGPVIGGGDLTEKCAYIPITNYALNIHIGAIFILAVVSFIGVVLPVIGFRVYHIDSRYFQWLKLFGAGVTLSTALVHVYASAIYSLTSPCLVNSEFYTIFITDYQSFAGVFCIAGILIVHLGQVISSRRLYRIYQTEGTIGLAKRTHSMSRTIMSTRSFRSASIYRDSSLLDDFIPEGRSFTYPRAQSTPARFRSPYASISAPISGDMISSPVTDEAGVPIRAPGRAELPSSSQPILPSAIQVMGGSSMSLDRCSSQARDVVEVQVSTVVSTLPKSDVVLSTVSVTDKLPSATISEPPKLPLQPPISEVPVIMVSMESSESQEGQEEVQSISDSNVGLSKPNLLSPHPEFPSSTSLKASPKEAHVPIPHAYLAGTEYGDRASIHPENFELTGLPSDFFQSAFIHAAMHTGEKQIATWLLAVGVSSHSVILGLALGISTSGSFVSIIIAYSFYLFFEGIAISTVILEAEFERKMINYLMMAAFCATAPIGVAIGTGIQASFNVQSPPYLIAQGIIDSFSAGVLLYDVFINILHPHFHDLEFLRASDGQQLNQVFAVWIGAALMSVLAKWSL